MTRASRRSKREAEDYFPHSVDILVPGTGLGSRLNTMLDWCRENAGDWAQHGHSVRGDPPRDYVGFMTSDLDIYRTANVLIREHGDEADLVAAQRADSFLEAGDLDGCAVWKRVLKAIKEIRRVEPREGEAVN
jgi:hypothetical protein